MTAAAGLALLGFGLAAGILAWGVIVLVSAVSDAIAQVTRRARLRRRRQTRPMDLAGLVIPLHDEHVSRVTAACDRCATGRSSLPCACRTDCYEADCLGWLDDVQRAALRGDS